MVHKGQFYDSNKKELMASDGQFVCDGRFGRNAILSEARRQARSYDKHFPHKDITYIRLYTGRVSNPNFITGYINLKD